MLSLAILPSISSISLASTMQNEQESRIDSYMISNGVVQLLSNNNISKTTASSQQYEGDKAVIISFPVTAYREGETIRTVIDLAPLIQPNAVIEENRIAIADKLLETIGCDSNSLNAIPSEKKTENDFG